MNEADAAKVVALLQAGFPRTDWPPDHIALWVEELAAVGATEGQLAARALIRTREWPSVAAFLRELAEVREMRLDARPIDAPALGSGERVTPRQEGSARIAEVRQQVAWLAERLRAPDDEPTSGARIGPPVTLAAARRRRPEHAWQRPDEDYFGVSATADAAGGSPSPTDLTDLTDTKERQT